VSGLGSRQKPDPRRLARLVLRVPAHPRGNHALSLRLMEEKLGDMSRERGAGSKGHGADRGEQEKRP